MLDPRTRYLPLLALVALVGIRIYRPDFLGDPVFWRITWFWLVFAVLVTLAAWIHTPGFVRVVNRFGRFGIVPPLLFLLIVAGILWIIDVACAYTFGAWFGWSCDALPRTTAAIFGGT